MQGGAFNASGGAALVVDQFSSILDGVTLDSAPDLSSTNGAIVIVKNNLTFAPGLTQQVGNAAGTTGAVISLQGGANTFGTTSGNATIIFGRTPATRSIRRPTAKL